MNQEFLQQLEDSCVEVLDSVNHLPKLAESYEIDDPGPIDVLADLLKYMPLIADEHGHWNYPEFRDDGKAYYLLAKYLSPEQRSMHAMTLHWLARGLRAMGVNLEMHACLLEGNTPLGYEIDESDEGRWAALQLRRPKNCKEGARPTSGARQKCTGFPFGVEEQKRRGRNQEELIFGNFVNESGFLSRDADLTVQLRSEAEEKQRYADRLQGGPKCPTNDPAAGAGMARGRTVAKWETPNVRIQ